MPKITYKQFIKNNPPSAGYPKWGQDNTSTVPNDPANEINRAKGQPNKLPPSVEISGNTKTVTDGTTSVESSEIRDPALAALGNQAPAIGDLSHPEKQHYPPCINPTCKSYGRSHPNCLCYAGPGGSSLEAGSFARGGRVCVGMHKDSCEHFADGGTIIENNRIHNNPADTISKVAIHHGLLGLLTKTGYSKSENKHKPTEDYIDHARRGHKTLHNHLENLFTTHRIEPDKNSREALKEHLQHLKENPEKILDVGGSLGDILPSHGAQLGALAGAALNHFNTIRPVQSKQRPLDELTPVDKRDESVYNRHLDIAQNPMMVVQHAKDGMLVPSDVMTLKALYPELHKEISQKAMEALITAKTKNMEIPYKQKQALSLLFGEPLDSTMTQSSMQAIIRSAGPQQAQQQQKSKPKKASGTELKQINRVNDMDATALQDRLMDKAKH